MLAEAGLVRLGYDIDSELVDGIFAHALEPDVVAVARVGTIDQPQALSTVQIFKNSAHTLFHGFEVLWSCQQNPF